MVAIYRVCEHSGNIECVNRVAVCEQGGSVRTGWQGGSGRTGWQWANRVAVGEQGGSGRTGWQCANRVAIYRVCEHSCNIECANRVAVCEQGGNI